MNSNGIKHEIKGEQAFTEDNILIYNLFVYDLPKAATVLNVTDHFLKFAKVIKVRFLGRGQTKKCIIHFADPKEAAKVLKETCHVFMNSIIRVGACPSLHQPDSKKLITLLKNNNCNSSNQINQNAFILILNDDCLEQICKKLPTADQIRFALTCRRFYDVVVMISKVKHSYLNTDFFNHWPLLQIRVFLQIVGPQVKTLDIKYLPNKLELEFYGSFCRNVENLNVSVGQNEKSLRKLIRKMQLLEELKFYCFKLTADFFKYLEKFKNLRALNIMDSSDVTGENIHLLCGLEKLSLNGYPKFTSWHFRNICKNLTNLKFLQIKCCNFLKTEDYEHISEHLLQLETLKLSSLKENYSCIAQLPKLKQLEMYGFDANEEFLINLVKFQRNQLQALTLQTYQNDLEKASLVAELKSLKFLHYIFKALNDEILVILSQLTELEEIHLGASLCSVTNYGVLKLLENCLKLKKIDLDDCDSLTSAFVPNAVKLLQKQRFHSLRTDRVVFNGRFALPSNRLARAVEKMNKYPDELEINLFEDNGGMHDIVEDSNSETSDDEDYLIWY